MREIKFRGKRLDNGNWIRGMLCYGRWNEPLKPFPNWKLEIQPIDDLMNLHVIIPETVGQYTGLKDKNGKEIYEGDIARLKDYHGERIVSISFYSGVYYYGGDGFSDEYMFNSSDREVIGNIHDNPELLT